VLLLVAVIVGYYLVDGIVSANNNAKKTKQLLIEQTFQSYKRLGENFSTGNLSPDLLKQFVPEILQDALRGELPPLYRMIKNLMTLANPMAYMSIIEGGKVVDYTAVPGVSVDPSKLPTDTFKGDYRILNSKEGTNLKGTLMEVMYHVDLSKFGAKGTFDVSTVYDLTKQVAAIDKYFNDQKRDTVIKLIITGVVALILFALLSTFWLRYLINKYIRRPMDELNTMAQDIAAGIYQGEVVVDEHSDFAALQGLLKSGQLILRKFDENMGGEG
jgi:methyl-accepting chemotaxis protein